jgi:hypothetical protein
MPSVQVYTVDFSSGNLVPTLDANGWGAMKLGNSGPSNNPTSSGEPQGLALTVSAQGGPAANGAYVVFGPGALALETRLLMQVEFDRPNIVPPASPNTGTPEPWAVALNVKFGNENFVAAEPMVTVTCQFNRQLNGVRLNTPGHQEGDQATILVSPLDYSQLSPGRILLEHHFCGKKAPGRYSIGYGSLSIGPPIKKNDQRVFSSTGLSGGQQSWIGALGVTLVTLTGVGQITVRLRNFSISMWS